MTQFPVPHALVDDLRQVEQRILERTHARGAVISAVGPRRWPGGEPIRAALVLAAALTGEYRAERVIHAAAAVELIYAATTTHGDLVDEAARRKGVPRAGEWGQGLPLMVGDYLFALAAGEMALTPDARVIDFYSQAVMQISEAALAPPPPLRPLEPALARHVERLGGAAALVAAACKAGGACAAVPPEQIEALGRFGHSLGLGLALAEEVRALTPGANPAPAEALRAGAVSMPLAYAAHCGDGERLAAALDGGDEDALAWAAAEVARHGLAPARAEVARLAARARDGLAALPPGPGRDALAAAADYPVQLAAGA
jgi:geranylgeranyl pyrophosphate synthase